MATVRLQRRGEVWWVFASLPGNQQFRRSLRTSDRAEAELRKSEIERSLLAGVRPEAGLTVGDWLERWLSDIEREGRAPTTLRNYRRMVRYIVPRVGRIRLDALTVADVERMDADLLRRGGRARGPLSAASVRQAHDVLASALHAAMRQSLLLRNVAELARRPKRDHQEPRWLERDEALRLLDAARSHPWGAFAAVAALTGLRSGELCGLRWEDVDFGAMTLRVERQWRYEGPGRGHREAPPKSAAGRRAVPMSAEVAEWLRQVKTQQDDRATITGANPPLYVFAHRGRGKLAGEWTPWTTQSAARGVGDLYRAVGLEVPKRPVHTLRHTTGALLAEAREDPKVRAALLGHSDVAQTYHYTHAGETTARRAMGEVGRLLRRGEQ